jgi:DNA-binding NtrC family response regulator
VNNAPLRLRNGAHSADLKTRPRPDFAASAPVRWPEMPKLVQPRHRQHDQLSPSLRTFEVSGRAAAGIRSVLGPDDEDHGSGSPSQALSERNPRATTSLQDARGAYEARYISQVLSEHGGNISHAALALRVSRVALQKKMKRYGLR